MLKKTDFGWKAEDRFPFNGPRQLCISTYKINGKLVTNAAVNKYEGNIVSHAYGGRGGDYGEYVIQTPGARGTEKAVAEQHALALAMKDEILERARKHYEQYPPIDR